MNFYDLLLQQDVNELHQEIYRLQLEHDRRIYSTDWDVKQVAADNLELKLRVGLLVRLLIAKGVFTAEEYAKPVVVARSGPSAVTTASPPATPP